ncbi:MAG: M14 family zinc carboxypeptidase [Candidatus Eisenbacteria bacterium]
MKSNTRTGGAGARGSRGLILTALAISLAAGAARGQTDPAFTPAELARYSCSPTWAEAEVYIGALAPLLPDLRITPLGQTAEGRTITGLHIRSGSARADEAAGIVKPVVLVTAGIHSGEICGKDAILALLRDLALGREKEILENLHLILVPVFNMDGHERRSLHHRFTQVGPECGAGIRRNGQRLDLNRDFLNLETEEVRTLVRQASISKPHLYIDLHTDDGIGHQYDLLFGAGVNPTVPGKRGEFAENRLAPAIMKTMEADGFLSRTLAYPIDRADLSKGFEAHGIRPRYSTGYFDFLGSICILSEANPYVSYERRVKATTSLLQGALRFAARHPEELVEVVEKSREEISRLALDPDSREVALSCEADRSRPVPIEFLGKKFALEKSEVTGNTYALYGDEDETYAVDFFGELKPVVSATVPAGYFLDRGWGELTRNLALHGVKFLRLTNAFDAEVEGFRVKSVEYFPRPYQGRHPIRKLEGEAFTEIRRFPAGTIWIPANQPAGLVAMVLLEPRSPDGALYQNAFDTVFEEGTVLETWALEENARKMLEDMKVRSEYEEALRDSVFAADGEAKLLYFFKRTPYADKDLDVAPVWRYSGIPPDAVSR